MDKGKKLQIVIIVIVLGFVAVRGYVNIQSTLSDIQAQLVQRESPIETALTRDSIAMCLKKLGCPQYQIAPYAITIEQECRKRKADWKYVLAQIRRESFFVVSAKSFVDTKMKGDKEREYAWGLMQIKPNTGKEIAGEINEEYDFYKLFDGVTNLRWGVYYFQKKMLIYGHNVEKAVKSYNGGSKKHWIAIQENYLMICQELGIKKE